jgi:hypothetical protein
VAGQFDATAMMAGKWIAGFAVKARAMSGSENAARFSLSERATTGEFT